jgi:N-acetylmuramoyl-L-alanine amidase
MNFIHQYTSENFNERPVGVDISAIVIHYTDMENAQLALTRLCDKQAEVSCHYVIDEDGSIYNLVPDLKRAWHAGKSYWRGRENVNNFSVGIEMVNPGTDFKKHPFTAAQMSSCLSLCQHLTMLYNIPRHNVIGHSDVAPDRKIDPGEHFNWQYLAENGIGLYPTKDMVEKEDDFTLMALNFCSYKVEELKQALRAYGYKIDNRCVFDEATLQVVMAFKRHFYQQSMAPTWTKNTQQILEYLLSKSN